MSLNECMTSHTHRQYKLWMEWLKQRWNHPSRTDHYLMEIACEVRRVLSKNPNSIKLKHFLLKWNLGDNDRPSNLTREQAAAMSKARWFGAVGFKPDKTTLESMSSNGIKVEE